MFQSNFTSREPLSIVDPQYTAAVIMFLNMITYCKCKISYTTQVAYYMGTATAFKTSAIMRGHCDSQCGGKEC
jgi:hypothetical protein